MHESLESLLIQHGQIEELDFDGDLELHLRERGTYDKHIVSFTEIREVFLGDPLFFENLPGRKALLLMVGPTIAGRFLTVPIEPTGRLGHWRPVTAFTSNSHHVERYNTEKENEPRP